MDTTFIARAGVLLTIGCGWAMSPATPAQSPMPTPPQAPSHLQGWDRARFDSRWSQVTDYIKVEPRFQRTLALRANGELLVWGWNFHGACEVPGLPIGVTWTDATASEDWWGAAASSLIRRVISICPLATQERASV